MIRFTISVGVTIGAIVAAVIFEGFNPMFFLGFTAFLVVVSIPVITSFGVWNARDVFTAWRDPFTRKKSESFAVSMKVLAFQEKLFYISGAVGTIIGSILVLNSIQNLAIDKICAGFAATLIAMLYGLLFAAIMRILQARIDSK
jgi:flagellar motor component MotA